MMERCLMYFLSIPMLGADGSGELMGGVYSTLPQRYTFKIYFPYKIYLDLLETRIYIVYVYTV